MKIFVQLLNAIILFIFIQNSFATEKPNIIFVLADDLGWSELGCYGNTFHETPNLDRMAKEGMLSLIHI